MGWFDSILDSVESTINKALEANGLSAKPAQKKTSSKNTPFVPPLQQLDQERQRRSREADELMRRQAADAAADRKSAEQQIRDRQAQAAEYAEGLADRRTPKVDATLKQTYRDEPVLNEQQLSEKKIQKEEAAKQQALTERKARDRALGRKPGVEFEAVDPNDPENLYHMTDADYYGLNDLSRGGVDSNTLIAEGLRSKDVKAELKARLNQLGIPTPKNRLDEFTSLKATVTDDDLKNILSDKALAKSAQASLDLGLVATGGLTGALLTQGKNLDRTLGNPRFNIAVGLAQAGRELRENLDQGWLKYGFDKAAAKGRGESPDVGDTAIDALYRDMFNAVAGVKGTQKTSRDTLDAIESSPEDAADFLKFAETRLNNSEAYGLKLAEGDGVLSIEEVRKLLGLNKRGEK